MTTQEDLEAMSDLEIKQYKHRLWALRQDATRTQDRELRAEMIRAQAVLDRRGRARTEEYERIAAETPGAVSTRIAGTQAGANSGAREV